MPGVLSFPTLHPQLLLPSATAALDAEMKVPPQKKDKLRYTAQERGADSGKRRHTANQPIYFSDTPRFLAVESLLSSLSWTKRGRKKSVRVWEREEGSRQV